jgi:uncharacterized cupin superfamily protein
VPEQGDHVGVMDVVIRARLPVAAERLLQGLAGRGRAEPRVAVQMLRADPRPGDDRERVVLLQEQLADGVEADRARTRVAQQLLRALDDQAQRLVPARLLQLIAAADQRPRQPVGPTGPRCGRRSCVSDTYPDRRADTQTRSTAWLSESMTNLNTAEFEDRGVDGFRVRRARVGQQAGAKKIGMSLWEIPPGQAAYPYHWHVIDEELIVVLDEGLSLRGPDGDWRPLPKDEVVAFGVGEEGGHQLWNRGSSTARFLSISSGPSEGDDIVFYPDADKIGVYARNVYELYSRADAVGYWDGERPPAAP